MISEPDKVRKELRRRILRGGEPYYSFESACDNGVDWTVLTEREFEGIRSSTLVERARSGWGRNEATPLRP